MALKIQGASSGNQAEVDAKNNLKSNTYTANTVTNLGTFGVTTTFSAIGGRINCAGYKYIRIFINATMTGTNKRLMIGLSGSHTVSGNLYPLTSTSIGADMVGISTIGTDCTDSTLPSGIYASCSTTNNTGIVGQSKSTGTDFVNRLNGVVNINGLSEIQLYAQHDDTGTINTTIDYVLFNN